MLEVGWWGVGWVIKGSLQKTSENRGWVKVKLFVGGEGGLKVSPPLPPQKILIIHLPLKYEAPDHVGM